MHKANKASQLVHDGSIKRLNKYENTERSIDN